jgi:nucleoid-associated protein EbfC
MRNIGQMMKQAQQLQEKMGAMQEKMNVMEIDGAAGSGMVTVVINGKGDLKSIKLNPSVVDPADVEMLEDLILTAFSDARAKADKIMAAEMHNATGGMSLPGMKLPF